jgi:diaminohydroxyphosphoribosylaminopyrimidine deaminase/5-amino-6-(5-phosphoribosylamino)uracil reductase
MTPDLDRERLRRAIALSSKGRFRVEPNPAVGCVLVKDGRVVGEGWHDGYGGPHAEVRALLAAGPEAAGATAYVSLEPCSRHGKTPPCTDALVGANVARVVFAASDPDPREGGRSAGLLGARGLVVEGPALFEEGDAALARFRGGLALRRPWTILKWAMSADGRIAARRGAGGRITGPRAEAEVHELRGRVDAVLVGRGTLDADDPRLTCRLEGGPPDGRRQPLRILVTRRLTGLGDARLLADAREHPVLVATTRAGDPGELGLSAAGVEVVAVGERGGAVDLPALAALLHARGVRRLLVEGGARVHGAFLRAGLADQAQVWVAPRLLGGDGAVAAVVGTGIADLSSALALEETRWRKVGDDLVLEGYVASARSTDPGSKLTSFANDPC